MKMKFGVFDHMDEISETEPLFVLAHVGVPRVEAHEWALEICGLVDRPLSLSLDDLLRYPQSNHVAMS